MVVSFGGYSRRTGRTGNLPPNIPVSDTAGYKPNTAIPNTVETGGADGTWFFPDSMPQGQRQGYLNTSTAPVDVYAGYTPPSDTAGFEAAVRAQYAPRAGVSPTTATGGYTPPPDPTAAFIDAIRSGGGNFGGIFGGRMDADLSTETGFTPTQDALWNEYVARQQETSVSDVDTSSGDGGAAAAAAAAAQRAKQLQALMDYLQGQQGAVGSRYDEYNQMLADAAAKAIADIGSAGSQTVNALSALDPMAAFQYDVPPTAMPQVASANYLQSIGASTADVDAARSLAQQLMGQQLGMGQRFAAAEADALAKERQARLAAAQLQAQSALDSVGANRLAYQAQVDAARNAELQALAKSILEAQLKYGVA